MLCAANALNVTWHLVHIYSQACVEKNLVMTMLVRGSMCEWDKDPQCTVHVMCTTDWKFLTARVAA